MADKGSTISEFGKAAQKTLKENKKGKFKTSMSLTRKHWSFETANFQKGTRVVLIYRGGEQIEQFHFVSIETNRVASFNMRRNR